MGCQTGSVGVGFAFWGEAESYSHYFCFAKEKAVDIAISMEMKVYNGSRHITDYLIVVIALLSGKYFAYY